VIYFVRMPSGSVKIGCTADITTRLKTLASEFGRVELLGTTEGSFDTEKALHQRFSHLRLGRTEQFKPAVELLAFIGTDLPFPDAVEVVATKRLPDENGKHVVSLVIDPELWQWVKDTARARDLTASRYIRGLIVKALRRSDRAARKSP